MQIIDGKALRDKLLANLAEEISSKKLKPRLAIVLIGDDEASLRYIKQKQKAAEEIGAQAQLLQLPVGTAEENLITKIEELNANEEVTGIIVQLPLPGNLDKEKILETIAKAKDVDGLRKDSAFEPATPLGILEILHEYKVPLKDKVAVVIGQSHLVGAPLSEMLENEGAKVTRIDINTPLPIDSLVQQGDIVIAAVGKVNLVTASMVKEGVVVIDVGTNLDPETGKLVGDVAFDGVKDKVSLITPVPGGVGPMTVAMLMKNLVLAATN